MRFSFIANRCIFFIFLAIISMAVSSCGGLQSGNFLKQKYLKGQLASVREDEQDALPDSSKDDLTEKISSERNADDLYVSTNDDLNNSPETKIYTETTKSENKVSSGYSDHPAYEKRLAEPGAFKNMQKKIPEKFASRINSSDAFFWAIVLLVLAVCALPFALLIGFWAFIISGVFLVGATVILFSSDLNGDGVSAGQKAISSVVILIILLGLLALVAIAAVIAIIWLIVWGIIQLIN